VEQLPLRKKKNTTFPKSVSVFRVPKECISAGDSEKRASFL
jgi:hypothetical protein